MQIFFPSISQPVKLIAFFAPIIHPTSLRSLHTALRAISIMHRIYTARFEVFTAATVKNGVFWDVTPCGSCKNRRFGGT
jgi:hypothetical protein